MTTDERLDQLEILVRDMRAYLLEFRTEVIQRIDQMESRLDGRLEMVTVTVQSLDSRIPALTKAVTDLQIRLGKLERPAA